MASASPRSATWIWRVPTREWAICWAVRSRSIIVAIACVTYAFGFLPDDERGQCLNHRGCVRAGGLEVTDRATGERTTMTVEEVEASLVR